VYRVKGGYYSQTDCFTFADPLGPAVPTFGTTVLSHHRSSVLFCNIRYLNDFAVELVPVTRWSDNYMGCY